MQHCQLSVRQRQERKRDGKKKEAAPMKKNTKKSRRDLVEGFGISILSPSVSSLVYITQPPLSI